MALRSPLPLLLTLLVACNWITDAENSAWVDEDNDGYARNVDCDDQDPDAGPSAPWYVDGDGDGWGQGEAQWACGAPSGLVATTGDCNDEDPQTHPQAVEICDHLDNDCDGRPDDEDEDVDGQLTWYADADGDGFGDTAVSARACEAPGGYVEDGTDCDDSQPTIYPAADELLDGLDNDCDGTTDLIPVSQADGLLLGAAGGDRTGYSLSGAGDSDGDGYADLLIGAADASWGGTTRGVAYLVLGPVTGSIDLAGADALFYGSNNSAAGDEVAPAGDIDGDGFDDFLVGADKDDEGGDDFGAAFLISGPQIGPVALDDSRAKLLGESANGKSGKSLDGAGDVNGDGLADLVVGAASAQSGSRGTTGRVYLFSGPVSGTMSLADGQAIVEGSTSGAMAGRDVVGAGDVNGDGFDDIIIGATGMSDHGVASGVAYLVLGPLTGQSTLGNAALRLNGEGEGDNLGRRLGGGGDVDGDGYPDLLVTCYQCDLNGEDSGAVYVVLGASVGAQGVMTASQADAVLVGENEQDRAGSGVDFAGDVDGDGLDEILVGAEAASALGEGAGAAYLVRGPVSGTLSLADAAARFLGQQGDELGQVVAGPGDVNADSIPDLLMGAPGSDSDAGAAFLFLGR